MQHTPLGGHPSQNNPSIPSGLYLLWTYKFLPSITSSSRVDSNVHQPDASHLSQIPYHSRSMATREYFGTDGWQCVCRRRMLRRLLCRCTLVLMAGSVSAAVACSEGYCVAAPYFQWRSRTTQNIPTVFSHSVVQCRGRCLLIWRKSFHVLARSQNCEKRLLASSCLSVRPPACMEQLDSHWTDLHEI
jgi:hypothetical protein